MRKITRLLAFFCALTLLFSLAFVPQATDNDPRFASYTNMGKSTAENGNTVPNLFRQDKPYSNVERFPLVVSGGVEYVPLSMFILYPYVEVNYSKTGEDFFLLNKKNNRYISFNVNGGIASTYDGDLLKLSVRFFNSTRYVPARTVALVLGFVCENYDNPEKGIYVFRISDGKSGKTLAQLVEPYLAQQATSQAPVEQEKKPEADPIEKLAERNVYLCYANVPQDSITHIMNTLDAHKVKASFSLNEKEILSDSGLVRRIYVSEHSLLVTADCTGDTPGEKAKSFVEGLERANSALAYVLKRKTRMCTLPYDLPEETAKNEEFISTVEQAGYIIFRPGVVTDDKPGYTGNAYNISSKIKNTVISGFDVRQKADVSVLLWCGAQTPYYTADVANLINKYAQFKFCTLNEGFVYNNQGE